MTAIESVIKDAIEKGGFDWELARHRFKIESENVPTVELFLDPFFWQALGKAREWNDPSKHINGLDTLRAISGMRWREEWHRFIDALAEGRTAEDFLSTL